MCSLKRGLPTEQTVSFPLHLVEGLQRSTLECRTILRRLSSQNGFLAYEETRNTPYSSTHPSGLKKQKLFVNRCSLYYTLCIHYHMLLMENQKMRSALKRGETCKTHPVQPSVFKEILKLNAFSLEVIPHICTCVATVKILCCLMFFILSGSHCTSYTQELENFIPRAKAFKTKSTEGPLGKHPPLCVKVVLYSSMYNSANHSSQDMESLCLPVDKKHEILFRDICGDMHRRSYELRQIVKGRYCAFS